MELLDRLPIKRGIISDNRTKIFEDIAKLSNKIIDTCRAKTQSFKDFRECAKPQMYRLNNITVDLNAAQIYAENHYKECVLNKKTKEECKKESDGIFMEYFKDYLNRIKKNKPDPEPFIDYDAFNELAEEEAEEDENEEGEEGGDDDDEDEEDED